MADYKYKEAKARLKRNLKPSRYEHSIRVVEKGLELNEHFNFGVSKKQIKAACLLHDCAKHIEKEAFDKYCDHYNLDKDILKDAYRAHAILGVIVAKEEYGVKDPAVLQAIRIHTLGKVDMTLLDKIVFLADAIEVGRKYKGVESVREASYKNINLGMLSLIDNTIAFLGANRSKLDKDTFIVRESIRRDIIKEKLDIVLKACEDKLGKDINTIKISEKSTIGDYFVVVTGGSKVQTKAIADEVEEKVEEAGYDVLGKEGLRDGGWILLDLGDIIVHVFTEDQREFYNLEKLWD